MEVILLQDVESLGGKGVARQRRARLCAQLPDPAEAGRSGHPGEDRRVPRREEERKARDARLAAQAEEHTETLNKTVLTLTAKAGEGERLFGSITAADIADAIKAARGFAIDKRKVRLEEPIKEARHLHGRGRGRRRLRGHGQGHRHTRVTAGDTPRSPRRAGVAMPSRASLFCAVCVRPGRYHEGSESRRLGLREPLDPVGGRVAAERGEPLSTTPAAARPRGRAVGARARCSSTPTPSPPSPSCSSADDFYRDTHRLDLPRRLDALRPRAGGRRRHAERAARARRHTRARRRTRVHPHSRRVRAGRRQCARTTPASCASRACCAHSSASATRSPSSATSTPATPRPCSTVRAEGLRHPAATARRRVPAHQGRPRAQLRVPRRDRERQRHQRHRQRVRRHRQAHRRLSEVQPHRPGRTARRGQDLPGAQHRPEHRRQGPGARGRSSASR